MKKLFWGFIVMSFFCSCEKRNDEGGSGINDKNEFTNIKFKNAALLFREGKDGELDVIFYDFASKNTFTYMRKKEGPAVFYENGTDDDKIMMTDTNGDMFPDIVSGAKSGLFSLKGSLEPFGKNKRENPINLRDLIKERMELKDK